MNNQYAYFLLHPAAFLSHFNILAFRALFCSRCLELLIGTLNSSGPTYSLQSPEILLPNLPVTFLGTKLPFFFLAGENAFQFTCPASFLFTVFLKIFSSFCDSAFTISCLILSTTFLLDYSDHLTSEVGRDSLQAI